MEKYYYNRLNKAQKTTYHAIKAGLESLAPSFQIPRLEGRELAETYFLLRLDCPEIFYAGNFRLRYYEEADNAELIPEYLFEKKKIKEHQKALKARIEKLVRPALNMSDEEKLHYIHDFICGNIHYDKMKKQYSHEIIGPLGHGVGVCEGIAKSFKVLCDALGIWCIIAISQNNPEQGIKFQHAWNIVRLKGKYYHIDATFDNTLGTPEDIRYDYFCISDKQLFRDHQPMLWPVPECVDANESYYIKKKLSFTKIDQVRSRAAQAVKKGKTLTFHWRGGYLTEAVLEELMEVIREEAQKKAKHPRIFLNWPQAILRITFEEEPAKTQLEMQEANEGEQI